MLPLKIRNRIISADEIVEIQSVADELWDKGRKQISIALCERWNWRQPSGRLKDMACREIMITLFRKGFITLPPPLNNANNDKRNKTIAEIQIDQTPIAENISNLPEIELKLARNTDLEPLYRSLVHYHHYLGYKQIVGNHLTYVAFCDQRPVACLGWGSAAWAVAPRESYICWEKQKKDAGLHYIANNTRFLILPWVRVKCLASKLLALNARRISDDWLKVYKHPLYLLETFVEQDRFKGTCYKAANWVHAGQTMGTAKRGHDHLPHGRIKDVFLYPLRKDFRKKLMKGG